MFVRAIDTLSDVTETAEREGDRRAQKQQSNQRDKDEDRFHEPAACSFAEPRAAGDQIRVSSTAPCSIRSTIPTHTGACVNHFGGAR